MKNNKEKRPLVQEWLMFAEENLLFAKSGMKEDFSPYHTICFMCQGSTEKYLKAFLIWNGWELMKIHNLMTLLAYCVDFDTAFEKLKNDCKLLNEYVTAGRYPCDLSIEMIGKKDAEEAIEAAEKVVLEKINF